MTAARHPFSAGRLQKERERSARVLGAELRRNRESGGIAGASEWLFAARSREATTTTTERPHLPQPFHSLTASLSPLFTPLPDTGTPLPSPQSLQPDLVCGLRSHPAAQSLIRRPQDMPSPATREAAAAGGAAVSQKQDQECEDRDGAPQTPANTNAMTTTMTTTSDIVTPAATLTPAPKSDPNSSQDVEMGVGDETKDKRTTGSGKRNNWRKRNRKRKVYNRNRSRPYPQPSREWDGERDDVNHSLNLDQEQEKRANFVKMSMQKYGKPYAPYNTTQFLMEDHNVREPEFEEISKLLRLHQDQEDSNSVVAKDGSSAVAENDSFSTRDGSDSDDFYSSPDDEQDFQQRQFSEVYEHVHAERLSSMNKTQLVQEYMLLEEKAEDLEKKLKVTQAMLTEVRSRTTSLPASAAPPDIAHLKAEIKRLTEENDRLRYASHPRHSSLSSSSNSSSVIADSCTNPEGNAMPTSTSSVS